MRQLLYRYEKIDLEEAIHTITISIKCLECLESDDIFTGNWQISVIYTKGCMMTVQYLKYLAKDNIL